MITIFEYTDYRGFLKEAIAERKERESSFTHRFLCASLGLKTSNYVLLVIQGKRNLTSELASKLSNLLGLKSLEAEYFLWMVLFAQSATVLEKEHFWRQMMTLRSRNQTSHITESQYEYYSHWFNPVIRELVVLPGSKWTPQSLSKALHPKISAVQVRHSLELLERLGMITKSGDHWVKASSNVATPPEVHSVAVFNYHRELMDLARKSLENDSGSERNITSLTLEMNSEEYNLVVQMLTQFRRNALAVSGSTGPSDRVYQMNLHLFPVSQVVTEKSFVSHGEDTP